MVWQRPWNRCDEPNIVVPDAEVTNTFHHAPTYWVEHEGHEMKFAVVHLDSGVRRFFVPADSLDERAFEARTPQYEGFWRSSPNGDEDLPWPQPDVTWQKRIVFLEALDRVEALAQKIPYRGFSHCRLCGIGNGNKSLRLDIWEWPEGFRHYVAEHQVRPTPTFEAFVMHRSRHH